MRNPALIATAVPTMPSAGNEYGWFLFLTGLFVANIYSFISGKLAVLLKVKGIILAPIDGCRLEPLFG